MVFSVPDVSTITVDGSSLKIFDVSSKQIYRQLQAKKQEVPTAQKKLSDKYPHSAVDWETVYSLSFCSSMVVDTRKSAKKVIFPKEIFLGPINPFDISIFVLWTFFLYF